MTVVNIGVVPIAITCLHCIEAGNDVVYVADRSYLKKAIVEPFGKVITVDTNLDMAFILPYFYQSITINSVKFLERNFELNFNKEWCKSNFLFNKFTLLGKKVFKVGMTTGLTEGFIVEIIGNVIFVDDFSDLGDSGSLVFTVENERNYVVGMLFAGDSYDKKNEDQESLDSPAESGPEVDCNNVGRPADTRDEVGESYSPAESEDSEDGSLVSSLTMTRNRSVIRGVWSFFDHLSYLSECGEL